MNTQIVNFETPELLSIEKSKAKQIKETFEPMVQMLETFEDSFNSILTQSKDGITKELTSKAKRLRLDVGKVRIETGKLKDKQKEYIKLEDKAIMGIHNIIVWAVTEKEDKLKEIENYFETQEKLRLEALQKERVEQLSKYIDDAHERRLSEMDEDVWAAYLSAKKKEYEDRIEAEKQAELQRIENERLDFLEKERRIELAPYAMFVSEKNIQLRTMSQDEYSQLLNSLIKAKKEYDDEQEIIRLENERLKKQAEAKEKELENERQKAKEEADKLKAENEAKLKAEHEAKAKLEAELRAKKDAEIKAENERKEAELKAKAEAEKLAKAPIKKQLNLWVDGFRLPESSIEHYKKAIIEEKFNAFKMWAKKEVESI